jgi:hypothetical protein
MKLVIISFVLFGISFLASRSISTTKDIRTIQKNQEPCLESKMPKPSKKVFNAKSGIFVSLANEIDLCPAIETEQILSATSQHIHKDSVSKEPQDLIDVESKISNSEKPKYLTEDEQEIEDKRLEGLKEASKPINKDFARFNISEGIPSGALYYGIHLGSYIDSEQFLGKKTCENPTFYYMNNPSSYLSAFFTINHDREFGGIVRIINEYFNTIIEAKLTVFDFPDEPFEKYIPKGKYSMWVHEEIQAGFKGHRYETNNISMPRSWGDNYNSSPWLYNSCTKSISTISNHCSIDPSYDMQFKDFFYLVDYDLILGNIYCKKSSDPKWTRISTLELKRYK